MTIEYTHKTQYGHKARILCDNLQSENNYVVAITSNAGDSESIYLFKKDAHGNISNGALILTEASAWDDVPVDTPIWVRNTEAHSWARRHFFKYRFGKVFAWDDGKTSHTVSSSSTEYSSWNYATLEKPDGN